MRYQIRTLNKELIMKDLENAMIGGTVGIPPFNKDNLFNDSNSLYMQANLPANDRELRMFALQMAVDMWKKGYRGAGIREVAQDFYIFLQKPDYTVTYTTGTNTTETNDSN